VRPLIIVERDELQLYAYLSEDYGAEAVEIIFDRRYSGNERRRPSVPPVDDRRRGDRRRQDVTRPLVTYGWVIVNRRSSAPSE
jgi:hypothetical protein